MNSIHEFFRLASSTVDAGPGPVNLMVQLLAGQLVRLARICVDYFGYAFQYRVRYFSGSASILALARVTSSVLRF